MSPPTDLQTRLHFLIRVVQRECKHLQATDQRLFDTPFTAKRAISMDTDPALAERVEAFASRFARLQDTLGNKLLPTLLLCLGEPLGALIDNLDRAEKLGWVDSVENWQTVRRLRNQMVHEYIEDPNILASALQAGHENVPMLVSAANAITDEARSRSWLAGEGVS